MSKQVSVCRLSCGVLAALQVLACGDDTSSSKASVRDGGIRSGDGSSSDVHSKGLSNSPSTFSTHIAPDTEATTTSAAPEAGGAPWGPTDAGSLDAATTDRRSEHRTTADASDTNLSLAEPMDGGVCQPLSTPLAWPASGILASDASAPGSVECGVGHSDVSDSGVLSSLPDASASQCCLPRCITELEELCLPSGECNSYFGAVSFDGCWENGVQVRQFSGEEGFGISTVSHVSVGGRECYSVRLVLGFDGSSELAWFDDCGQVIATGTKLQGEQFLIACTQRDEAVVVDFESDAYGKYADGAPNLLNCSPVEGCPM